MVDPDGTEHPAFGAVNRNKRSLVIDVRAPEGLALIDDLVRVADVVVNNYRPGVMDRLGLGYERLAGLNPRVVYAQGTGFGTEGTYVRKGGQDILAQALTGAMSHKADPDHPTAIYPISLADYSAGMNMVQGILMALLQRERTGRGQRVEVSLYDSLLAMQILEATMALMGRATLNWARMPLVGTFATTDGEIVLVGAFKPNPLRDICAALDLEDLSEHPDFSAMEAQAANKPRLQALLAEAIGRFSTAEVIERLETQGRALRPRTDPGRGAGGSAHRAHDHRDPAPRPGTAAVGGVAGAPARRAGRATPATPGPRRGRRRRTGGVRHRARACRCTDCRGGPGMSIDPTPREAPT